MTDLNFTHSLSSDIFNLSPNAPARNGEIVTGSMVVNLFDVLKNLENYDAKVFSELFSNEHSIISAGENPKNNHQKHHYVAYHDYDDFIMKMKTKIKETANISAFGRSE